MITHKNKLRRSILLKRNDFSDRCNADKVILDKLVYECDKFEKIFVYVNYGSEVNTTNFIKQTLEKGKRIFVPVCNPQDCTMCISRITSLDDLIKNRYGILEPSKIIDSNEQIDVAIFPGVAFDLSGNRIGYGKGYYDKYMSNLTYTPYKIGICYDFQLINEIPFDEHDVKLDRILTESRTVSV